jgi:hypothetical protein
LFAGVSAEDIRKVLLEEQKGIASERMSRIKSASGDLDRCQQRIDTLVRSVADGMPVHMIKTEIQKLDEEKTFLTGVLQTLRKSEDDLLPSLQEIESSMEERRRAFDEHDTIALRTILHACIDHIKIWPPVDEEPEKMLIHWTDGTYSDIFSFKLSSEENALLGRKAFMKSKGLTLPEKDSDGSVIGGGGAHKEALSTQTWLFTTIFNELLALWRSSGNRTPVPNIAFLFLISF